MGNCCCDRRDQAVSPSDSKDLNTTSNDNFKDVKNQPEERQEEEQKRPSGGTSTTESETRDVHSLHIIRSVQEMLSGLERKEELSETNHVKTQTWIGAVDMVSAHFAIKLIRFIQGEDLKTSAMVRFGFYTTVKQSNALRVIVSNLHATKRCVRHSFAHLLEVMLCALNNLTFSLAHDLMALDILPSLDRALQANETPEYHLCISNVLHCLYTRNLYMQKRLIEEEFRPLLTRFLKLLTRFTDCRMVRIHAQNLCDFSVRHDGTVLSENWRCLEALGLPDQVEQTRERLRKGNPSDELVSADTALRQLLAAGMQIALEDESTMT